MRMRPFNRARIKSRHSGWWAASTQGIKLFKWHQQGLLGQPVQKLSSIEGITRIITVSKDDSPAADQAAIFKVAGQCRFLEAVD